MKRIVYGLLATLSGVVLLFSYRTSLEAVAPTASDATTSTPLSASASQPSASATPAPSASASDDANTGSTAPATSASGMQDGTYTGNAVRTAYGNVQVQITVSGGAISNVQVLQYPNNDARDRQINERALPQLMAETTDAQSAAISMVSGATYTSNGYIQSLQSAIDQAQP